MRTEGPGECGLEARLERREGRATVMLSNGDAFAAIELSGAMVPIFGIEVNGEALSAHWIPPFHRTPVLGFLDGIAGDFICSPNFGPDCSVRGVKVPVHGWTANDAWRLDGLGLDKGRRMVSCDLSLDSPSDKMPLAWRKRVAVLEGQSAYYDLLSVRNDGAEPLSINIGHHNTLGSPFLEPGCRISLAADRFMVPPKGSEFDSTGRLAIGEGFESLGKAPLRSGGTADLRVVPGMIGSTDFVTGPVPRNLALGWSCVVNPRLGLAYLCFFPGAAGLPSDEIALSFNDLWMQYGGRRYKPWAETEGGPDRTYCLGTENATGAFANGLAYSIERPELLGLPTTVLIPAGGQRRLCYGTALVELTPELVLEGISAVEPEKGSLILKGARHSQRLNLEGDFSRLRAALDWPDA